MTAQAPVVTLQPVDWVLECTASGDHGTWAKAFSFIETNHVPFSPTHWGDFVASVVEHGVRTPLVIWDNGTDLTVISGHHRVWGAHKVNLDTVPVIITTDLTAADRILNEQSDNETDWKHW